MEENKEKPMLERTQEETEKLMKDILDEGIKGENIEFLYRLVDIHKDIANEDYWKTKKEEIDMRYRAGNSYGEQMGNYGREQYGRDSYGEYGNYGEDSYGRRSRDSRGRYSARGYDAKYRGDEMLEDMKYSYGAYSEGREQYGRGNYGAKEDTMKSLNYMLQSVVQFMEMLEQDASSQEEVDLIKKYTKKISEM